jgi:hypothetical protein
LGLKEIVIHLKPRYKSAWGETPSSALSSSSFGPPLYRIWHFPHFMSSGTRRTFFKVNVIKKVRKAGNTRPRTGLVSGEPMSSLSVIYLAGGGH